jgi:RHS repeat-associated protein
MRKVPFVERYGYDPWGKRRNPDNWTQTDNRTHWLLNRGYTMHEHLDAYGIINMNGRVYDPLTAQFFSPDPFVQAPGSWLNYNRYGYCLNNPMLYTDSSGEFWHLIIGAAIGGIVNWAANGAEFSWQGLGCFGVGALAGALGAGIGAGISSALPIAGQVSGGFAAGFWGTSAATTATSSFVSGALVGGGSGLASGFTTGFGNALVDGKTFGQALGQGGIYGAIGLGSGALIGGIVGGN